MCCMADTLYSSHRLNEIFYDSIHLSKNALYYCEVTEMVTACLTIPDSIYLMCVSEFIICLLRKQRMSFILNKR